MKVVPIRDGAPALTDIPGMLRKMADDIEAGSHGEVTSAFLLLPVPDDYPKLFGWGDATSPADVVFQYELAKAWMINNLVERRS